MKTISLSKKAQKNMKKQSKKYQKMEMENQYQSRNDKVNLLVDTNILFTMYQNRDSDAIANKMKKYSQSRKIEFMLVGIVIRELKNLIARKQRESDEGKIRGWFDKLDPHKKDEITNGEIIKNFGQLNSDQKIKASKKYAEEAVEKHIMKLLQDLGTAHFLSSPKGSAEWNWATGFMKKEWKTYNETGGDNPDMVDCILLKYYMDNSEYVLVTHDRPLKLAAAKEAKNRDKLIFDPFEKDTLEKQ